MAENWLLTRLDADYQRLREVAEDALAAPVPSCPGWNGADLVRHVAEVYLHKTETMRRGTFPTPWPPDLGDDLLAALAAAYAELSGELTARKPEEPALTWYGPDQTVGFWIRRMAHETVIHRLDAEQAAGVPHAPIPTDLAEDGIDEVLVRFLATASAEELGDHLTDCDGRTVQIDTGSAGWQIQLGPTEVTVERGRVDAEAAVYGEPGPMLRWLWRRAGNEVVQLDGNTGVIIKLRQILGNATQ